MIELSGPQVEALGALSNGKVLCGGVGSGKSRVALAYYVLSCGGGFDIRSDRMTDSFREMCEPRDLVILTTAKKRDSLEWETEALPFTITQQVSAVVDSWNNIKKYVDRSGCFFIFDEQRVVGKGAWVDSFYEIASRNRWILLSATPGDTWMDYVPLFVANGFFKNRTEFYDDHVRFKRNVTYPVVDRYFGEGKLERLRRRILVEIRERRDTVRSRIPVVMPFDKELYNQVVKTSKNPWSGEPLTTASAYCQVLREISTNAEYRANMLYPCVVAKHDRVIVFYNFNYERDALLEVVQGDSYEGYDVAEWSGHRHDPLPDSEKWVYLVQYTAGAEGWNCVTTNAMVFFSPNYSYKVMEQAEGRIDRRNTPYEVLYYYNMYSLSRIDSSIRKAVLNKKKFNERGFAPKFEENESES